MKRHPPPPTPKKKRKILLNIEPFSRLRPLKLDKLMNSRLNQALISTLSGVIFPSSLTVLETVVCALLQQCMYVMLYNIRSDMLF